MRHTKFTVSNNLILFLCFVGFLLNYLTYFPGFMSPDSLDQFRQALRGQYDDWHPPVFAYVWRQLNKIEEGPELMLALHLIFLWLSCYLFSMSFRNAIWRIGIFLLFFLAPFIHNFSGWILKDVAMAFSWLLATSVIFHQISKNIHYKNEKPRYAIAAIIGILLLYGCWLRYNAIVALLPLVIAFVWTFLPNKKKKTKIIYSIVFMLLVFFGQPAFNKLFLKANVNYTEAQIYFHDLSAIYIETGENVFPNSVYKNQQFDTTYIRTKYNPLDVTALLWNTDNKTLLYYNKELTNDLKNAWLKAIWNHSSVYIKHRCYIYYKFLALDKDINLTYYYIWIHPNDLDLKIYESTLYKKYATYISTQKEMFYFRTWFWIFLNIALLPLYFLVRNRSYRLLYTCVALSGFLYTAPQIIVANFIYDFRYIYWSCFACIVSVLILIADLIVRQNDKPNNATTLE